MTRPRIAVSSALMHADPARATFKGKTLQYTEERLVHAIARAGGSPFGLLDLCDTGDPRESMVELLTHAHGLVLQGGVDVSPELYGERPLHPDWSGDPQRDHFELLAIEVALAHGLPILGVCRGMQLLNVALGGTLWQDIESQVDGSLLHRDWARYDELEHAVRVAPGSWLAGVCRAPELCINTVHHQGVKDLAAPARASAFAPDGLVEALECIDERRWAVGVQWHPEWLDRAAPELSHRSPGDPIFAAFVHECRRRAGR